MVMPLLTIHVQVGRTAQELGELLDAVHASVVEAFDVPPRDRYQIVHEHEASHLVVQDTGLGIERTRDVVVVQVTSRPRPQQQKQAFYRLLCEQLERHCGIGATDVVVAITENTDDDWSFGLGRAQFLTGELS
jgi:phenylpyruvate tautomerase PptA (4-oxalocrotonate tautomerase family)